MKRILACTDGSSYGEVCLRYAGWLAQRSQASLDVAYVTDIRMFETPVYADYSGALGAHSLQAILGDLQKAEGERAQAMAGQLEAVVRASGFAGPFAFHHRTGILVDQIFTFEPPHDIILLGKRGLHSEQAKAHLGSNMERVVRASSLPCLVTNRAFKPIQRMLLAYDGSPSMQKARDFLLRSPSFKGLELHLVNVIEDGSSEEKALALINPVEQQMETSGYYTQSALLYGEVESALADYVSSESIDLLIIGAYGHSRIRELILGSSTETLLRTCRVPVLCFR